jgi:RNA-directed DNA polymerase
MDILEQAPSWLLRPLPANAVADAKLNAKITKLGEQLPGKIHMLHQELGRARTGAEYDVAANLASVYVWKAIDQFYDGEWSARSALLAFAMDHMVPEVQARICRRLVKDPATSVRKKARKLVERGTFREVALPATPDGDWDATGWLAGTASDKKGPGVLKKHKHGKKVLARYGLPPLSTIGQLRKLFSIRTEQQLGFLLVASDHEDGPYTRFSIPKSDGSDREICAPKKQLRWVQRRILSEILDRVPAHGAAHGFVRGRSTVTNAAQHQGAELLLKFDLMDFFPTIHYFRVIGLFAGLGYAVGNARFQKEDDAKQIAPTLARLCCYTPDPRQFGNSRLPQGAPTSPAISNLVCRRLDARLDGLAKRNGGTYTRYADDLTFSFKTKDVNLGRFRWWVDQICHQEGFFINQRKFRVIRASQRQLVTGIVVNDELRVPREQRRQFRAILHNCRTHGVASQARDRKDFASYLRGFASYVHMVQPEEGAELLRQVEELLGPDTEESGDES